VRDTRRAQGQVACEFAAGTAFQAISITLPQSFLAALRDEGALADHALAKRLADGRQPTLSALPRPAALRHRARQLLHLPATGLIGQLHLESAALGLAADLLAVRCPEAADTGQRWRLSRTQQQAIEAARAILTDEFSASHTISSLARRVGINECYLKRGFRALTGCTIAEFLRHQRLQHARTLIEDMGASVQDAASYVGYTNCSHFADAFRRLHGCNPSHLIRA
jgi:AraC-like DNA-binding protein